MGGDGSQKLLPWRGPNFPSRARQTSGSFRNQYLNPWLSATYCLNDVFGRGLFPVEITWQSAERVGHFWRAWAGHFRQAPKVCPGQT